MSDLEVSSAGRRTMLKKKINKRSKPLGPIVARTSDAALEANRARTTALLANTLELIATTGL
jgi:ribosomal protein S8